MLDEVRQSPEGMLEEVLDFVRFLKSGRFAAQTAASAAQEDVEVLYDAPRTLRDLADEQRAFLSTLPAHLEDIDLPSED